MNSLDEHFLNCLQIEPLFILCGQDHSPVVGLAVTKHELIEAIVSGNLHSFDSFLFFLTF